MEDITPVPHMRGDEPVTVPFCKGGTGGLLYARRSIRAIMMKTLQIPLPADILEDVINSNRIGPPSRF